MQLVSSNHPHITMAIYLLSLQSLSLTVCTFSRSAALSASSHPSAGRSSLTCKFAFKHVSSFSNIICEFSNIFPSFEPHLGWRRVSARGKWVDTFPNYSPPEDLCYPPTNKLTKFSSPAHATHCTPAYLARPCARHQHLT